MRACRGWESEQPRAAERRARADEIRRVDDDHVELLLRARDELHAVAEDQPRALVVEGALVPGGQMLAAGIHGLVVDVDHHRSLDRAVSEHLAQGCALAPPHHQHGARLGVEHQRRMHQRLVIDELVQLG